MSGSNVGLAALLGVKIAAVAMMIGSLEVDQGVYQESRKRSDGQRNRLELCYDGSCLGTGPVYSVIIWTRTRD